jgi:predicted DNA binding CopG/RHH family protein
LERKAKTKAAKRGNGMENPDELRNIRFANEAEEAAWLELHEDALTGEFEKRIANGYRGPANLAITGDSTVAKIRLSAKDVVLASKQAKKRGLRCEGYLKSILHHALQTSNRGTGDVAS